MKILIAGDFVPQYRVAVQIEKGDYSCLNEVKPIIQSVDYAVVNFESPVVFRNAKPIAKAGPNLKCSEKAIECVAKTGFRCVTLANNHFRDYGQIGVEDTIDTCAKNNIDYVGGGKNKREAQQVLYKTLLGQTLAIVNICENEFSICSENHGGSNPLNPIRNYYTIKEARQKAEYVLVVVHGGVEGYQYPTPRMQETYRFFVDLGADAVVNHHQHCYSGYEVYHGKPIFYGLGNFCFDRKKTNSLWENGYLVCIDFSKEETYTIYPYTQGTDTICGVSLLKDKTKDMFFEKLTTINEVISNTITLQNTFDAFIQKVGKNRLLNMEPLYNKQIRLLQKKGLLPRLIKGKSLLDTYDRLNCETHNEILREVLKQEIDRLP